MHKWIVTALALFGISYITPTASTAPPSNGPSRLPKIQPSKQAPLQLIWLDGDGSPYPPKPGGGPPPCCI